MPLPNRIKLYVILSVTFVSALLLGDTLGGKLMEFRWHDTSFVLGVGMIPFPITFLITDLLNEFYGKKAARFVTWVGLALAIFSIAMFTLAVALPWAPFAYAVRWDGTLPAAYDNVFGGSRRMLLASTAAYVVGQLLDISVFNYLKRVSKNRYLWLRATGSTVVSQWVDTVFVQALAWSGILPFEKIVSIIVTSYALKLIIAIALTPLIYLGHTLMQSWLRIAPVRLDEEGEATVETLSQRWEPMP
jgi:queuosine precursor transporter